MATILDGLLGGVLVALVAAAVARVVTDGPSTATAVLERVLGSGGSSLRWAGSGVQVLYGCLAGGALVALELYVLGVLAVPPSAVAAFGVAVAWSALLFGFLSVVVRITSVERSRSADLLVFHLVFGLGLGLWIRVTWIT